MYQQLFKRWKSTLGFAAITIVSVIVLFSGDNSLVSRIMGSFGPHDEVAAPESVATESVHPVNPPQPEVIDDDSSFYDDADLVDDGQGDDPSPEEGSDNGDGSQDDSSFGDQIVVNPDDSTSG